MRKITEKAVEAFLSNNSFNGNNTKVSKVIGGTRMYLHNNCIAENINGRIGITNCGWFTNTTKERLNGIPGVSIRQVNGNWILNGNLWDGAWIEIDNAN